MNNDSMVGLLSTWGKKGRERRKGNETTGGNGGRVGSVSFPTGILLQLLLERDKAVPEACRSRHHSAIVFKVITSETGWLREHREQGYARSFAAWSSVWIWISSVFMPLPCVLLTQGRSYCTSSVESTIPPWMEGTDRYLKSPSPALFLRCCPIVFPFWFNLKPFSDSPLHRS